ncbi:unnamed protein product [Trichobilharzia szidati]|nr:unnamed protein product [Trichobilharzia szidati]
MDLRRFGKLFCLVVLWKICCCDDDEDVCLLKPEPGRCRAAIRSYYYDSASNECKKFIYGGCGGNGNRFSTLKACEDECKDICLLKPEPGMCRAYFPSFYYDQSSNECKKFVYGGCGGNENRFTSKDTCEEACKLD